MSESPLVSIVTPSYNQGRYIEDTILSVLDQDYPHLEYIVVDGGSTDNTSEILAKYGTRLVWSSGRDHGQADAINKGFHMAKGEILGWLNSDDTYLPGAIGKIVHYFQTHPDVDMVYGQGHLIDPEGVILDRYPTEPFDRQRLREGCFICQPTVFFRATVPHEIGPLNVNLQYCLDYEYWLRIAQRLRIEYLNEYVANARVQMEAKTVAQPVQALEEALHVVQHYYQWVPASWINIYAYFRLRAALMPNLQGIDKDGWTAQRVRILLHGECRRPPVVVLKGVVPQETSPLSLRIAVEDRVLHETVLPAGEFSITTQRRADDISSPVPRALELTIHTDKSFLISRVSVATDFHPRSYRIRHLSVSTEQGRALVCYTTAHARLFSLLQPFLFLGKFVRMNRCLPWAELKQSPRLVWRSLKKILAGPRTSQ